MITANLRKAKQILSIEDNEVEVVANGNELNVLKKEG